MTMFTYEIAAPTNVIEASASPEPDDVSLAYIRIEAVADKDIKEGDISEIRFEINIPPEVEEDEDKGLLTRNPGNITPVAAAFEKWTFSAPEEGDIFYARPDAVQKNTDSIVAEEGDTEGDEADKVLVSAKQRLVFYLYDIEVIDRDGITLIKVTEVDGAGNPDDTHPELEIRKIFPALRIDFFTTDQLSVPAGTKVDLNWATTSATEIKLSGITEADRGNKDNPQSEVDSFLSDTYLIWETKPQNNSPGVAQKDGVYFVRPETTTTYTLRARNNKADTLAIRQLTVTVTDKITAQNLEITNRITANSLRLRGRSAPKPLLIKGTAPFAQDVIQNVTIGFVSREGPDVIEIDDETGQEIIIRKKNEPFAEFVSRHPNVWKAIIVEALDLVHSSSFKGVIQYVRVDEEANSFIGACFPNLIDIDKVVVVVYYVRGDLFEMGDPITMSDNQNA